MDIQVQGAAAGEEVAVDVGDGLLAVADVGEVGGGEGDQDLDVVGELGEPAVEVHGVLAREILVDEVASHIGVGGHRGLLGSAWAGAREARGVALAVDLLIAAGGDPPAVGVAGELVRGDAKGDKVAPVVADVPCVHIRVGGCAAAGVQRVSPRRSTWWLVTSWKVAVRCACSSARPERLLSTAIGFSPLADMCSPHW